MDTHKYNFELLDSFAVNSKAKQNVFWRVVFGDIKKELLYLILLFLPFQMFLIGFVTIIERIGKHLPLYFIGVEKYSAWLPHSYSVIFNLLLWIAYFSISIALIVVSFRPLIKKGDALRQENSQNLVNSFSPIETVIFSSIRISEELAKYANSKMPSDMGLGGDLDWIEGLFYKILTGKRPTGSYSGANVDTNSFFANLNDEADVIERLKLYDWYNKEAVAGDQIISKLFKLKDFIFKVGFWHDYSLGAVVFKAIAQTFLFASLHQNENFRLSLDHTLEIYEEYKKSKAPLKGIPHYTVRFAPKVVKTILISSILLVLSVVIIFFLPRWVVVFSKNRLNLILNISDVKDTINIYFVLLSFLGFLFTKIWKK
jgi:hypothetical protein